MIDLIAHLTSGEYTDYVLIGGDILGKTNKV